MRRTRPANPGPGKTSPGRTRQAQACYTDAVSVTLSEAESRRLVAEHGVAVSPFVTGDSTSAILAAMNADESLYYPVVAKLCGRRIAHKSERGLVRLGINDQQSLRTHCDELLAAAEPADGDVKLLVTSMARGSRELIAGLHNDPQFGLLVMLGVGGVLAEAFGDVTFRLAPITETDAEEMIGDLSAQALLGEFRGEPALHRQALIDLLLALCEVGAAHREVVAVDLNPLILVDGRPLAVDALAEVTQ